jgi:hypothetical protein
MCCPPGHASQYRQLRKDLAMSGETNLSALRAWRRPELQPDLYAYCIFGDGVLPADVTPVDTFREMEGVTAILQNCDAD